MPVISPGRNLREHRKKVPTPEGHVGGANILLVDNDNGVREAMASMLRNLEYEVMEAGSGGTALHLA